MNLVKNGHYNIQKSYRLKLPSAQIVRQLCCISIMQENSYLSEEQSHLFIPFFRGENAHKQKRLRTWLINRTTNNEGS